MSKFVKIGDASIIPYPLIVVSNMPGSTSAEKLMRFQEKRDEIHKTLGMTVSTDECYIWVSCTTPNNFGRKLDWSTPWEWSEQQEDEEYLIGLTQFLPLHLFKGKKEGDTVKFMTKWGAVKVTLRQKESGSFEEVLERLLKEAGM